MGKKFSRVKFELTQLVQQKYQGWIHRNDDSYESSNTASTGDIDYDLYLAASRDNVPRVEQLLKLGADGLAPQGDRDLTALHVCMSAPVVARICGSLPRYKLKNLDQIVDDRGNSPLHAAAQSNRVETLLCLIECGFDLSSTNNAGRTPSRVAYNHTFEELHRLIDQLVSGKCWCGDLTSTPKFDLERSCQLYLQIYSYREVCEDVFAFISDQKTDDTNDANELEKKLKPLLEAQEERKKWAREKKEKEEAEAKSEKGLDINTVLAKALKDMAAFDKEQRLRAAAEEGGFEYVPKEDRDSESDDSDEDATKSSPKSKKESVKTRIANLQKKLNEITDPARWRAFDNVLGFPRDLKAAAESILLPSLALHVRLGCPTQEYICPGCSNRILLIHKEHHTLKECKEAFEQCSMCKADVKKKLLKNHQKHICLAREWVNCLHDGCGQELKSTDLRKHMKLDCSFRKKKCKFCQHLIVHKEYKDHEQNHCEDRCIPCVVVGCTRTFHQRSEQELIRRHEKKHLQDTIEQWTPGMVGFWLEQHFPFFGDFLLLKYQKNVLRHGITGRALSKYVDSKDLREKVFMKLIGMPEDHAYTVCEAIVGRTTPEEERWAEHPKKVRAGAFLSREVRMSIAQTTRERKKKRELGKSGDGQSLNRSKYLVSR